MNLPKSELTEDEPIRCVICKSYCDDSGLCDEHKYDEQKTELINDKTEKIRAKIAVKIATSKKDDVVDNLLELFTTLIHQTEITAVERYKEEHHNG